MGAMTLLVERRGAELSLSKSGEVVSLRYPDGKQHRVGLYALQRIVIHGDVNLSTTLLRAAEEAQVSVVLLPARGNGNHVNLFPYLFSHVKRRQAQYQAYFDEEVRLALAKKAVSAKILAQSSWLNEHDLQHNFENALAHLQKAPNNAALMGIEGSVTKQYFALWRKNWDRAWGFNERNRRPPRDPVNALLSLGYTLAGNSVGHLVATYRLDNSFGFLHTPQNNRPSLALDLLEPVRPWVDEWLWRKAQAGLFTPKQFTQNKQEGCRLDNAGRNAFYSAWYEEAEAWLRAPMRDSLAGLLGTLRQKM